MKQTNSLKQKEQQFALSALALCGVLSLAGFASAATFTWVGPNDAESYYATSQLHAAAPASSFPTTWVLISLLVGLCALFCAYKLFLKRKHR